MNDGQENKKYDYPCARCKDPYSQCLCEPHKRCSCGSDIWFVTTPRGKSMPLNEDGTSHHFSCPKAKDYRK